MTTARLHAVTALLVGMALLPSDTLAVPIQYGITDLGTLGGPRSYAYALNNSGQVVGCANTGLATYAFLWQEGTMVALDKSGGNSCAYDVSNTGWAVGYAGGSQDARAALWHDGTRLDLPKLRSYFGSSWAYGINAYGQIVGITSSSYGNYATIWDNGDVNFARSDSSKHNEARSISDSGQAVGTTRLGNLTWQASAFSQGNATVLAPYPTGMHGSFALGINNLGQIVGYDGVHPGEPPTTPTMGGKALLWDAAGGAGICLASLGGENSYAHAINDSGLIVGSSETADGGLRATLWSSSDDHTPLDLTTVIPPDSGWAYLAEAYDINDSGQIVGYGRLVGNSFDRAFLLTPVPEPATFALLALGGLALLRRRHSTHSCKR